MDGVHDMGGMHGFGSVIQPGWEMPYHSPWEPRIFAIHMLVELEGLGAGPGGRAVREEMEPAAYLSASYYERWLFSAERRLQRKQTVAPGEVERMMVRLTSGE
ncbi:MAG: nitrile hydratase subunit beta, partial [Solirubrobacteraceae bacterium]